MTGASRRKINREGNILQLATQALNAAKCSEDCDSWLQHSNPRVRMLAWANSIKLPRKADLPNETPSSEFDLLVERFKAEGKKDPIKSARASLAASARKRSQASIPAQV